MSTELSVSGEVILPSGVHGVAPEVTIAVEDISRADAPSTVVGISRQRNVSLKGRTIPFQIKIAARKIDERALYSVRAHIQMSDEAGIARGDFISVQTYPVLTQGHGRHVRVELRRV